MIKEMAFVSYPVTDIARATAFYRDTIGLIPGESFGDSVVEFDIGGATFAVDAESIGAPGTQCSVAFEVDDIVAMRAALVKEGVPVTEVLEFPPCFAAFVTDPDGNRFALHQRKI
jgi:predicted enzyme related to lactoylglutathione lyase